MHEFALFCEALPQNSTQKKQLSITEPELVHRIKNVLRLKPEESLTLFSSTHQVTARILSSEKKQIIVTLEEMRELQPLSPAIHWLLPLLDREAYEHSLEQLTVMGAASITPIITEKSRRKPAADFERTHRLLVAAAEQSKQFVIPTYKTPITLAEALTQTTSTLLLFCHPDGIPAQKAIEKIQTLKSTSMTCVMGPEGDFTAEERLLLKNAQGVPVALTKTILRSETALTVFLGILRSFILHTA